MAKDIHKGILLDDEFNKIMEDVQKSIDRLYLLAEKFEKHEHTTVTSQVEHLNAYKGYFGDLTISFKELRTKKG